MKNINIAIENSMRQNNHGHDDPRPNPDGTTMVSLNRKN